jgi:hypothetical protein
MFCATTSEKSGMILNDFLELYFCSFLATDICCARNTWQEIIPKPISELEGEIPKMSDSEASFRVDFNESILIVTNQ